MDERSIQPPGDGECPGGSGVARNLQQGVHKSLFLRHGADF